MRRFSSLAVLLVAGFVAVWAQSSQAQRGQGSGRGRGQSDGPQGWAGTPPSAEPPLDPEAARGGQGGRDLDSAAALDGIGRAAARLGDEPGPTCRRCP